MQTSLPSLCASLCAAGKGSGGGVRGGGVQKKGGKQQRPGKARRAAAKQGH